MVLRRTCIHCCWMDGELCRWSWGGPVFTAAGCSAMQMVLGRTCIPCCWMQCYADGCPVHRSKASTHCLFIALPSGCLCFKVGSLSALFLFFRATDIFIVYVGVLMLRQICIHAYYMQLLCHPHDSILFSHKISFFVLLSSKCLRKIFPSSSSPSSCYKKK